MLSSSLVFSILRHSDKMVFHVVVAGGGDGFVLDDKSGEVIAESTR